MTFAAPPGPLDPAAAPPPVHVHATWNAAQLRAALLQERRRALLVPVGLMLLGLGELGQASPFRVLGAFLILASCTSLVLRLLLFPRRAIARGAGTVEWTVDQAGIRLQRPGSDLRLAWSHISKVVGRRSVVAFTVNSQLMLLPRRCVDAADLRAVATHARAAGVAVGDGVDAVDGVR